MPYSSEWVEPEVFVEHGDVTVYHIYKDDDISQGARRFWFTLDEVRGSDCDPQGVTFDVRDLPFGDTLDFYPDDQAVRLIIQGAIDSGALKAPTEEVVG